MSRILACSSYFVQELTGSMLSQEISFTAQSNQTSELLGMDRIYIKTLVSALHDALACFKFHSRWWQDQSKNKGISLWEADSTLIKELLCHSHMLTGMQIFFFSFYACLVSPASNAIVCISPPFFLFNAFSSLHLLDIQRKKKHDLPPKLTVFIELLQVHPVFSSFNHHTISLFLLGREAL